LSQKLSHEAKHKAISVGRKSDELAYLAPSRDTEDSLLLSLELVADAVDLCLHEGVCLGELAEFAEGFCALGVAAFHGEPAGGLGDGEGEKKEKSVVC
jgi:hypothetical protein